MSKWSIAVSHQWEMELKAWKALLAVSENDHDVAHCVIKIQNLDKNLRDIDLVDEQRQRNYAWFEKDWGKYWHKIKDPPAAIA